MSTPAPYGYGPAGPVQAPPRRPPLSVGQKRGAMIAGGVGYTLMSLGFGTVFAVVIVTVVFGVMGFIGASLARSGGAADDFVQTVTDIVQSYWWIALVVAILGVALWLAGYFASVRILKSSGNSRATAITWAALGIGIVAGWVASTVLSIPGNMLTVMPSRGEGELPALFVGGGLLVLASLAVTVAIGVFAWWWMAHALRPAAPIDTDPSSPTA
ncbi:hypothetical protein FVA74_11725 [Salinibacterium sp. dk2585]|uniref:hypothetical protein n=1 Tax=unclassified Salinibacterium TaxID=2632331 RepID=UPI0011C25207|nr:MULTISPECIES: hypothetical protein [unclassified Salinibacterium]QEE62167.1 hypothetical protein FVA74_11725 [Salinibacterium sp. dk2585]TXK53519.1 hypothetical protein FVP63_09995 [Salinibacterium sp. dk5596]